jgi:RNA polymerase sigma factor (sigma-70 family)
LAKSSRFPSTRRSAVLGTRSGDPAERRAAWERVITAYWKPAYAYVRLRWRRDPDRAADLVQGFFTRVLEKDFFAGYDPAKGTFRTYFRVCLDRYVGNQAQAAAREKRGGDARTVSLDFAQAEAELARRSSLDDSPDECFHREWQRQIFGAAVDELRKACEAEGKAAQFALFERSDLGEERVTYETLAAEFGLSVSTVTNHLAAMRSRLRAGALERLRAMTLDAREFEREARALGNGR